MKLCQMKSFAIIVMLLTLPSYHPGYPDYDSVKSASLQRLAEAKVPWLDLQILEFASRFPPECFENDYVSNQHLTYQGSIIATQLLFQYINDSGLLQAVEGK